jgi:hypothetical protein
MSGRLDRNTNRPTTVNTLKSKDEKAVSVRRSLYVPVSVRAAATAPCIRSAVAGVRYSGWTAAIFLTKSPSRAMAKTTRAPDRVSPFTHPKLEMRMATAMNAPPAGPIIRTAASVAIRFSGTSAISEMGTR